MSSLLEVLQGGDINHAVIAPSFGGMSEGRVVANVHGVVGVGGCAPNVEDADLGQKRDKAGVAALLKV